MFQWLRQAYDRLRESGEEQVYAIVADDDGFSWSIMKSEKLLVNVRWSDVLSVTAFKHDLLTYDNICLAFETADGWVEVHEEMQGYDELIEAAERHLPSFPVRLEWYGDVMLPPFETCERVLWVRE